MSCCSLSSLSFAVAVAGCFRPLHDIIAAAQQYCRCWLCLSALYIHDCCCILVECAVTISARAGQCLCIQSFVQETHVATLVVVCTLHYQGFSHDKSSVT